MEYTWREKIVFWIAPSLEIRIMMLRAALQEQIAENARLRKVVNLRYNPESIRIEEDQHE